MDKNDTITPAAADTPQPGQPAAKPQEAPAAKARRRRWFRHKDVNQGQQSFAAGRNIYKIIWVFIIGCVIGVAFETFYVYATSGVLMRRSGMLYGPFNQIYGMGAVLFTLLLYRYRDKNGLYIFVASAVLGLGFEYAASWAQELLFGSVSWEYSGMATSIGGRTNLLYGVGWGVLGFLFLTHMWPFLSEMIERIPNRVGKPLTIALAIFLSLNLALSGMAVFRQKQRVQSLPAQTAVGRWLDNTYPDEVMRQKYPSMQFVHQAPEQDQSEEPSEE